MKKWSESKKRGCPTCNGNDPKTCMRCYGKTRLCDWYNTKDGWDYLPLEDAPSCDYKDGVMEAYGMLQIDAEFRDIEWEDDRREWIKKWGMVLVPE